LSFQIVARSKTQQMKKYQGFQRTFVKNNATLLMKSIFTFLPLRPAYSPRSEAGRQGRHEYTKYHKELKMKEKHFVFLCAFVSLWRYLY
jgi:hypothetical protein